MATLLPTAFAELAAPLFDKFGDGLTIVREGERVRWSYADASAVVEQRADNAVAAVFLDAPAPDAASPDYVYAVYAPQNSMYALTERGVRCMVDDLAAFFSGVREPRFTFVDACRVQPG